MELAMTVELLGRVPIFQGLSLSQLTRIAKYGREVPFQAGAAVLQAGETGSTSYLILDGFVVPQAQSPTDAANGVLGHGTFLGEMAMLVETMFTITVIARWDVRALALSRDTMYMVMEKDPGIAHHFAGKLVARLKILANDIRRTEAQFERIENSLDEAMRW
jgi:CRP-like cAMP-binding protein